MTLIQIAKSVCIELGEKFEEVFSEVQKESLTRARHIFRTIAHNEFKFTPTDIAKFEMKEKGQEITAGGSRIRSTVYHSMKTINDGVWEKEYVMVLNKLRELFPDSPVKVNEITKDGNIIRVTQEAFDSRFYGSDSKINTRTGNKWFPSWHFLFGTASPTDDFLVTYYKSKGFFSDFEFHRAEVMVSYVHNRIEDMGKHGIDTTTEQIYRSFPNPKEARRVEECLMAWINFVVDEEPQVISYEQMVLADDWGGTVDLRCRIKSDNYENLWTIDFKTSKSVYDSHKSQVESYRREFNDDKAGVLILGNSTKKRYTFTEVKAKERDYFYNYFLKVKDLAYHILEHNNRLQPHQKDMPEVFTLKGLNITRI